jgi:hypothetical protein
MAAEHEIEKSAEEFSQKAMAGKMLEMGNYMIQWGIQQKVGHQATVTFSKRYSSTPTVVLSHRFSNPVGSIDTLTQVSSESFTVASNNSNSQYYFHWLAIGDR